MILRLKNINNLTQNYSIGIFAYSKASIIHFGITPSF